MLMYTMALLFPLIAVLLLACLIRINGFSKKEVCPVSLEAATRANGHPWITQGTPVLDTDDHWEVSSNYYMSLLFAGAYFHTRALAFLELATLDAARPRMRRVSLYLISSSNFLHR